MHDVNRKCINRTLCSTCALKSRLFIYLIVINLQGKMLYMRFVVKLDTNNQHAYPIQMGAIKLQTNLYYYKIMTFISVRSALFVHFLHFRKMCASPSIL